jgi:cysteine synthase A
MNNKDSIAAYHQMAEEIWTQTQGQVDGFVQSVCTAGSLRGNAEALRRHNPQIRIVTVEPSESAVLSGGQAGAHKIPAWERVLWCRSGSFLREPPPAATSSPFCD